MRKQRGGGILDFFRTVGPAGIGPAGPSITINWSNIFALITFFAIITVFALVGVYFGGKQRSDEPASQAGGATGPPMSNLPGQIVISNILGAPSAGQAIVYFSKKEAAGTTCDDCTVQFDVTLTYKGGSPQQEPKFITLTAPISSGTLLIPYGESPSGFSPLQPGHMGPTAAPTSVLIKVDARVMSRENPAMKGGLTTFSKTIPYIA